MSKINEKTLRILANISLLFTGAIWGGGFVVMKNALDSIPVNYLLAIRFLIGAVGLGFSLFSRKQRPNWALVWKSAVIGLLLYLAFMVQTYGLTYTTAGKNALVTAFYTVLVPLFGWYIYKRRPDGRILIAACVMLLGIALLCLGEDISISIGDVLTLICAVLYAVEIIAVDRLGEGVDILQFSCLQFAFASLFAFAGALLFEDFPKQWSGDMVGALLYCGVCATLIAITLMNVGIRYASPDYASLFMSTESAFGCLFGVLFLHEAMTGRMLVGCVLILAALTVSQLKPRNTKAYKEIKENGI